MSAVDIYGAFLQQYDASFDENGERFRKTVLENFLALEKCVRETETFVKTSRTYIESLNNKIKTLQDSVCHARADLNTARECIEEVEKRIVKLRAELHLLFRNSYYERSDEVSNRNRRSQSERNETNTEVKSVPCNTDFKPSDVLNKYASESNVNLDNYDVTVERKNNLVIMILQSKGKKHPCKDSNMPSCSRYPSDFNSTPNARGLSNSRNLCSSKSMENNGRSNASFSHTYLKKLSEMTFYSSFQNKTFESPQKRDYCLSEDECGSTSSSSSSNFGASGGTSTKEKSSSSRTVVDDHGIGFVNKMYFDYEPACQRSSILRDARLSRNASKSDDKAMLKRNKSSKLESKEQVTENLKQIEGIPFKIYYDPSCDSERESIQSVIEITPSVRKSCGNADLIIFSEDTSPLNRNDEGNGEGSKESVVIPNANEGKSISCASTESIAVDIGSHSQNGSYSLRINEVQKFLSDGNSSAIMSCRPKVIPRRVKKKSSPKAITRMSGNILDNDVSITLTENIQEIPSESSNPNRGVTRSKSTNTSAEQTAVKCGSEQCINSKSEDDNFILQSSRIDSNEKFKNSVCVRDSNYPHKKFRSSQGKRTTEPSPSFDNLYATSLPTDFAGVSSTEKLSVPKRLLHRSVIEDTLKQTESAAAYPGNDSRVTDRPLFCDSSIKLSCMKKVFNRKHTAGAHIENSSCNPILSSTAIDKPVPSRSRDASLKTGFKFSRNVMSSNSSYETKPRDAETPLCENASLYCPGKPKTDEFHSGGQAASRRHAAAKPSTYDSAREFEKRVTEGVFSELIKSKNRLP